MTRAMFPLSCKREDTFIAGLSMGGFGAIRNGLKYYDTFGYIGVLSGAVQIFETPLNIEGRTLFEEDQVFGDLNIAIKTDKNPRIAFEKMKKNLKGDTQKYPKIYMACGKQDELITPNHDLFQYLKNEGVSVIWNPTDGGHNWDFWRDYLKNLLDWLPLQEAKAGISSGNVRG